MWAHKLFNFLKQPSEHTIHSFQIIIKLTITVEKIQLLILDAPRYSEHQYLGGGIKRKGERAVSVIAIKDFDRVGFESKWKINFNKASQDRCPGLNKANGFV